MALLDFFKGKEKRMLRSEIMQMVNGYTPSFTTYSGGVYEMDLTVSAIHAFAKHVSKANPKVLGNGYKNLATQFQFKMNDEMTTSQFLYRSATIYKCENNVFIIPITDMYGLIVGWYPISTIGSRIIVVNNVRMLHFRINNIEKAIPYDEVIHLKSHHYSNELFGDSNRSLDSTMNLIDIQNQGITNGIKQSSFIRFIAKIAQNLKSEDITRERDRLAKDNLSIENNSGVFMFDQKYEDIKQVDSKPFIVDAEQSSYIRTNVYNYFGVNENILQNKFDEVGWGSYYEGEIEPFLIQLSQAMTVKMFTDKELAFKNQILWESSRLQYADTNTKLNLITQLYDRGFLTHNQGLEIMNLPTRIDGDKYFIRLEYTETENLGKQEDKTKEVEDDK